VPVWWGIAGTVLIMVGEWRFGLKEGAWCDVRVKEWVTKSAGWGVGVFSGEPIRNYVYEVV
jgi:hypothetical protein